MRNVKFLKKEQSEASATLVPSPLKLGAKGSNKNGMADARKAAAVQEVSPQALSTERRAGSQGTRVRNIASVP